MRRVKGGGGSGADGVAFLKLYGWLFGDYPKNHLPGDDPPNWPNFIPNDGWRYKELPGSV